MSQSMIHVLYRVCDSVECIHGNREIPKKEVIWRSLESLVKAMDKVASLARLHIVYDQTSKETKELIARATSGLDVMVYDVLGHGWRPSFQTAYDIAKKQSGYILFLEDDYILSEDSLISMYDFAQSHGHVCLKPWFDRVQYNRFLSRPYSQNVIFQGNHAWITSPCSTFTFWLDSHILEECKDLFDQTFRQLQPRETYTNQIFSRFNLYCPFPFLGTHYHSRKDVYEG